MKVVEQSAGHLRLAGSGVVALACDFDRDNVEIVNYAFAVPYRRRRIVLSQGDIVIVRRQRRRGRYATVFRPRFGRDITLALSSKDEALAATRLIRDFLKARGHDESLQPPD